MNQTIDIYKYIALGLDFEGSISVQRPTRKNGSVGYGALVTISNTNKEILQEFKNTVGFGNINNGKIRNENKAKIYLWSMTREEIEEYLSKIIPYLIVKQRQAELIIELFSIVKSFDFYLKLPVLQRTFSEIYTSNEINTMNSIYWECKELNKNWNENNNYSESDLICLNLKSRGC